MSYTKQLTNGIFCSYLSDMTKKPQPFSVRLDPEVRERLERLAEFHQRSPGNMLKVMLSSALDQFEAKAKRDGMKL